MKMSYFPGGSPEDLGFSPCGGGGGGGGFIVEWCYTSSRAVCPNQKDGTFSERGLRGYYLISMVFQWYLRS